MGWVFTGLFIAAGLGAEAQQERTWADGPLTWDDFAERPAIGQTVSELGWEFRAAPAKERLGDTLVKYTRIDCILDKYVTWADPGHRTPAMLQYHQVYFDLVESCRRRMQRELYNGLAPNPGMSMLMSHATCQSRLDQYRNDTGNGTDSLVVEQWAWTVAQELASRVETPGHGAILGDWTFGLHVDLGHGFFAGELGDHLTSHFNVGYGFDFGYKRTTLSLGAVLSGTHIRKDMPIEERWVDGERLSLAILDLAAGYQVFRNKRLALVPTLGLGLHAISSQYDAGNTKKTVERASWNLMYGLNADVKLRKAFNIRETLGLGSGRSYNETLLRIRLYTMESNFGQGMSGLSPNFSIGICWTGRAAYLHEKPQRR